jgi:hypothetical protein
MDTARLDAVVPQPLRDLPQWVVWRYEKAHGKPTKVPYDPTFGRAASTVDRKSWGAYEQACQSARAGQYDGIGFVFSPDDPYCGIDLDDCLDEQGRFIWGRDIVEAFPTYAEVSPSGRGVKLFFIGRKPDNAPCKINGQGPDKQAHIEVYDRWRFFTVTGNVLEGAPGELRDCQDALNALYGRGRPPAQTQPPQQRDGRYERCLQAMLRIPAADKNDGSYRLVRAASRAVEYDLSDAEAIACIREYAGQRPFPTDWTDADITRRLRDAEKRTRRGAALAKTYREPAEELAPSAMPQPLSVRQLMEHYPVLRPPVIHGLLRQGETMNVISAQKMGKSWMVTDLALATAMGREWMGFQTEPGEVLIIDNELHGETIANRVPKVAAARSIPLDDIADRVYVENLRGRLVDIFRMEDYFLALERDRFRIIILDAFYRFLPKETDENDNGTMANIYNAVDAYADRLGCSFVLVHHSTKGNQSGKAVTDVGAGAGAQSRAADTHLILRPHEETDVVVLDAAVRSWPPIQARCLRWVFPLWTPADDLDPALLRPERPRKPRRKPEAPSVPQPEPWTVERFVGQFIGAEPRAKQAIIASAKMEGVNRRDAEGLFSLAIESGAVHRWAGPANKPQGFASQPQSKPSKRKRKS